MNDILLLGLGAAALFAASQSTPPTTTTATPAITTPQSNVVALTSPIANSAIVNITTTYGAKTATDIISALKVSANAGDAFNLLGYVAPTQVNASFPTVTHLFTQSEVRDTTSALANKSSELAKLQAKYKAAPAGGTLLAINELSAQTDLLKRELQYGGLF